MLARIALTIAGTRENLKRIRTNIQKKSRPASRIIPHSLISACNPTPFIFFSLIAALIFFLHFRATFYTAGNPGCRYSHRTKHGLVIGETSFFLVPSEPNQGHACQNRMRSIGQILCSELLYLGVYK